MRRPWKHMVSRKAARALIAETDPDLLQQAAQNLFDGSIRNEDPISNGGNFPAHPYRKQACLLIGCIAGSLAERDPRRSQGALWMLWMLRESPSLDEERIVERGYRIGLEHPHEPPLEFKGKNAIRDGSRAHRVAQAIGSQEWVSARDLAERTGVGPGASGLSAIAMRYQWLGRGQFLNRVRRDGTDGFALGLHGRLALLRLNGSNALPEIKPAD